MNCASCGALLEAADAPCPDCGALPAAVTPTQADEPLVRSPLASWVELVDNANIGWGRRGYEKLIGTMVGEYEVTGWIGEGGMGAVLSGIQPLIGKKVAIKILKTPFISNPESMRRFVDEARAVNEIGHPNIVDIFSFGQFEDGTLFFVMEYLDGETFTETLSRGPLTYELARWILADVLDALEAAHAKGIVHRDLKPDNIFLIRKNPGKQYVKLLDFGVAKFTEEGLHSVSTTTGLPLGTPIYMSPEQCNGHRVDPRSDLYSLGVLMYQMFTGRLPFDGTFMQVLAAHFIEEPTPPSRFTAIPRDLEEVILRCLKKDPDQRPQTAAALKEVLLPLLEALGRTQRAPTPVPGAERHRTTERTLAEVRQILTPRTASRHGRLLWAMGSVILGLAGALTWALTRPPAGDPTAGGFSSYSAPATTTPGPAPVTPASTVAAMTSPEPVLLQLQIEPAGVTDRRITVDGREMAETFFRLNRSEDHPVTIRVEAAGHLPWERRVLPAFSQNIPVLLKPRHTGPGNGRTPPMTPSLALPDVL